MLGALILFEGRPALPIALGIVGFFAVFHGHAHGTELPENASALTYSLGFVMATGLLMLRHRDRRDSSLADGPSRDARGGRIGRTRRRVFPVSRVDLMRLTLTLLFTLLPAAASAHLVESGFGDFYDGALHLIVTPGDLLIVIGIALLGSLQGAASARAMLVSLLAGWLAGGMISFALPATFSFDRVVVVGFWFSRRACAA